jgi:hypothetical protein
MVGGRIHGAEACQNEHRALGPKAWQTMVGGRIHGAEAIQNEHRASSWGPNPSSQSLVSIRINPCGPVVGGRIHGDHSHQPMRPAVSSVVATQMGDQLPHETSDHPRGMVGDVVECCDVISAVAELMVTTQEVWLGIWLSV